MSYKQIVLVCTFLCTFFLIPENLHAQGLGSSFSPTAVGLNGGDTVVITGTGFVADSLPTVLFGGVGVPPNDLIFNSSTQISVLTQAVPSPNSVQVYLIAANGTKDTLPGLFTYNAAQILSLSPNSSSTSGNDTISISGLYMGKASSVLFGAAGVVPIFTSDKLVKVVNPPHVGGSVSVRVETQATYSDTLNSPRFTYNNPLTILSYTVSLIDSTNLGRGDTVFVLGYCTQYQKMLTILPGTTTGVFSPVTADSGYVQSYALGSEITEIQLSNTNPINGVRIYFFVADSSATYVDSSNQTANGNLGVYYWNQGASVQQVQNPPQSAYPPYNYIEPTFETDQGLFIDVSTVDGFFFPLSISAQDSQGKQLGRIGQPSSMTGASIVAAYKPFINAYKTEDPSVVSYLDLYQEVDANQTVLYNPGLYLTTQSNGLDTVFNQALNTLFTDTSLKMSIWQNGLGLGPSFDYFTVTPQSNVNFPNTNNTHDALMFQNPDSTYYVFNPVGFSVISYEHVNTKTNVKTMRQIKGTVNNGVLTFTEPLPLDAGFTIGMYVNSGGGCTDKSTQITAINTSKKKIVSLNLSNTTDFADTAVYQFAKAPTNYYSSAGLMVFAGIGLMADGSYRYSNSNSQVVVNGIENQISTALNRGVAVVNYGTAASPGYTTDNWASETSWYPTGQPQNYFSYFMHTAKVGGVPIFTQPPGAVQSARKDYMSMAYGFAYDENPMHSIPGPQVPSEFSGAFPAGTTQLSIVLGPWK